MIPIKPPTPAQVEAIYVRLYGHSSEQGRAWLPKDSESMQLRRELLGDEPKNTNRRAG